MGVGGKLDREIARVHRATIQLQPEARTVLPYAIFRQRIGPQIVPLRTHPVASFAHRPRFPPAEFLSWFPSCCFGEASKKAVDASSVLDML